MQEKGNHRLSFVEKLSYGFGDCAANVYVAVAGTFLSAFYTDMVGIAVAAVGTMMLLARIFDGATDLIMGAIVDKTKSKYGKARPWVLWSAPFMCVGLILLFTVPMGLSSGGKLAYAYITYIFMNCIVYTANNLPYNALLSRMTLNVQDRAGKGEKLPVIVSVHGGGWVYGDKERYQFYCMNLAQRGFAVVNFTYRLAPENKFPASLEDTNSVFTWVLDNAEKYGFDTTHVFGVGDSAGGHGLGLYAAFCTNRSYAAKFDFAQPEGFAPTAVALNCGAYNPGTAADGSVDPLIMDLMLNQGTPEELALINVLNYITEKYPPTFLMTAPDDFLKAQAAPLATKLLKAEVPFISRFYGSKENRLAHVFHLNIRTEDAKLCNDEECEFFRRFC